MHALPPLVFRPVYYGVIEEEITRLLNALIYRPLLSILMTDSPDEMLNSMRAIVEAVRKGTVWYEDGQFKGKFNSRISKEMLSLGARFNTRAGTWSLSKHDLPVDVQFAQAAADSRYDAIRRSMLTTLDDMDVNSIDRDSKTVSEYSRSLNQMEMDFRKSITGLEAVAIPTVLTAAQKNIIAEEWGKNLDLYIKGWAKENILKLREEVQANTLRGGRAEAMVATLQHNYNVSRRKAEFLARQETSLLMSKFRETRYGSLGVSTYRWSTSHDERVRPDHAALNGKVFSFDSPPITCKRTGARNNPGEDFECRCVAIGLVN